MKNSRQMLTAGLMLFIISSPLIKAEEPKTAEKSVVILVDSTKNNGSFEAGELDPWAPVTFQVTTMNTNETNANNIIKVVKDAAFASKDKHYLSLQAAGDPKGKQIVARLDLRNLQGVDLEKGRTFVLTWDTRNSDKGFDTPIAEFLALTKAGAVMAKGETLPDENSATSKWVTHHVKFVMPESLAEFNSIHLRVGFAMQPTEPGATYLGFMDNITLIQSK